MNPNTLERFIEMQEELYEIAFHEISHGKKRSHWMWFIFPQLRALGKSQRAIYFGIRDLAEARAYMQNPYLRDNLIAITQALLALNTNDPVAVMGEIDGKKLCSSMTLFEIAAPDVSAFSLVLEKFYRGIRDPKTIALLSSAPTDV